MSLRDTFVATEADAIVALAKVKVGIAVSTHDMNTVGAWCDWEVENLRNTVHVLVPGTAAPAIQADLAAVQVALNAASSKALSGLERYMAVKKADVAVATLAIAVVGS